MVVEIEEGRGAICEELLRSLPLWFGIESALQQYVADVEGMTCFGVFDGGRAVGFLALQTHSQWTAEIHVMAVHPEFHRQGIGRELVAVAEQYLRDERVEFLTVKTLSPARANREYVITRNFYFSLGFRVVEEFKTLWGEENPCLLLIKAL